MRRCNGRHSPAGIASSCCMKGEQHYHLGMVSNPEPLQLSFLDASSHLYKNPCPSIGPSVRWPVRPSDGVTLSSKSMKNGLIRILNVLEGAGRGRKRGEEEGGTRRK